MNNVPNSTVTTRKRLLVLIISITFLFCVLFGRLGYLQLVARKDLQSRAAEQWYRDLPLAAPRGKILDSTGSVLADNREVYSVYVRPNAVTDKQAVAAALSGHLNLVYDKLLEKIRGMQTLLTCAEYEGKTEYFIKVNNGQIEK